MSAEEVFTALGEPVRRRLLETIAEEGPLTGTELARIYPISRQGILKHLQVLQQSGLLTVHQQGRDKRYALEREPLGDATAWIAKVGSQSEERLTRLKSMLEDEQ